MICNNNYLADILRVCGIKDFILVMRFQSPLVYNQKWNANADVSSKGKQYLLYKDDINFVNI